MIDEMTDRTKAATFGFPRDFEIDPPQDADGFDHLPEVTGDDVDDMHRRGGG